MVNYALFIVSLLVFLSFSLATITTIPCWVTAHLFQPRTQLVATSIINLAIVAGGYNMYDIPSSVVDIYNITSNTWTTANLSQAGGSLAAISIGNLALFA